MYRQNCSKFDNFGWCNYSQWAKNAKISGFCQIFKCLPRHQKHVFVFKVSFLLDHYFILEIQFEDINVWPFMPILWPKSARKCHKTGISGHRWLRWLQMAGSQWILVGSGWDTSRMVRWGHLDPPKLPQGPPGVSRNGPKMP